MFKHKTYKDENRLKHSPNFPHHPKMSVQSTQLKLVYLLIGILILIISFFYIHFVLSEDLSYGINQIEQIKLTLDLYKDYYPSALDFEKIESIAQEVANSHEYKLHVFDCTDFSKELVKRLRKEGYKAQCTSGTNSAFDYIKHTWVSIWIENERFEIESTGGYFIDDETYKTYKVKWENYCW